MSGDALSSGTTGSWLALSTQRTFTRRGVVDDILYASNVKFEIRDATSLTVLATALVSLEAILYTGGGGCPFCCFAPGTQIRMADPVYKNIEDVVVGDHILTADGERTVSEIIVREDRTMLELAFDGGITILASDDHPFFVEGKGWASWNPTVPYKDIGIPKSLEAGDRVRTEDGGTVKFLGGKTVDFPGKVYTFKESRFYANGLLVY
jgi:hypothetical protein